MTVLKRVSELSMGVLIVLIVLGRYNERPLLQYIGLAGWLSVPFYIGLVLLAARLIAGKRKDYTQCVLKSLQRMTSTRKQ